MICAIYSSGETGADQAALRAGKALGLKTGGYAPPGWMTEAGPSPWLGAMFGLTEYTGGEQDGAPEMNALVSDGLLIIGTRSRGANFAERFFHAEGKPSLWLNEYQAMNAEARFRLWIARNNIQRLFVCGNRERRSPGIGGAVERFLLDAIPKCR